MNRNYVAIVIGIMSLGLFFVATYFSAPQTDYNGVNLDEEKYQEIISNRSLAQSELISSIKFNDNKIYFASEDRTWYYSIVENSQRAYNPSITLGDKRLKIAFNNSHKLSEQAVQNNEQIDFIVYNDSEYLPFKLATTTLPLIELNYDIAIKKEDDTNVDFELFDNRQQSIQRITHTSGKAHIRGGFSLNYPKNSYRINLRYSSVGQHRRTDDRELLGMYSDDDWILYAPYRDTSKIRNVALSQLWRNLSADNDNLYSATGGYYKYVEVIENGKYTGLFALGTPINEKNLGIYKNTNNYDEYIFKKDYGTILGSEPEISKENYKSTDPIESYELKTAKTEKANEAWKELREYLYKSYVKNDVNYILDHTDMNSVIDVAIFAQLNQDIDKIYKNNLTNMYIALLNTKTGRRAVYIPWDFDLCLGGYGHAWSDVPNFETELGDNFITSIIARADKTLEDRIKERYAELRSTHLSTDKIMEQLEKSHNDVNNSGAIKREHGTWPDEGYEEDAYEKLVNYTRKRLEYADYYFGLRSTEPTPLEAS